RRHRVAIVGTVEREHADAVRRVVAHGVSHAPECTSTDSLPDPMVLPRSGSSCRTRREAAANLLAAGQPVADVPANLAELGGCLVREREPLGLVVATSHPAQLVTRASDREVCDSPHGCAYNLTILPPNPSAHPLILILTARNRAEVARADRNEVAIGMAC